MKALKRCSDCACALVTSNPTTSRILGLCPLLAVTNTFSKSLTIGVMFSAIALLCGVFVGCSRALVSWRLKPMYYVLVAVFATSLIIAFAEVMAYSSVAVLGVYPALIASNCYILSFMQEVAERQPIPASLRRGLSDVALIIGFLAIFGAVRELLAFGSITLFVSNSNLVANGPLPFIAGGPGALLLLAVTLAGANTLARRDSSKHGRTEPLSAPTPATGR